MDVVCGFIYWRFPSPFSLQLFGPVFHGPGFRGLVRHFFRSFPSFFSCSHAGVSIVAAVRF